MSASIIAERPRSFAPVPGRAIRPWATWRFPTWLDRSMVVLVMAGWVMLFTVLCVREAERRCAVGPLPAVAPVSIHDVFFDTRPVALTITAAWVKVPHVATRDEVRSDVTLWRRMHFDDWESVPPSLRGEALDAMLARYDDVLASPATWDRMGPLEWDLVPQPIRAMAFRHMAEYWSGYYQLGAAHGIPRRTMADTLGAMVMSESWFEHRAITVNQWGNRDLGVAQACDATRRRMTALYHTGVVDVLLEDDDYFDPWKGTRFLAVWMGLLLDEVKGDLDAAVAAYHRGAARAHDRRGREYLDMVKRRLHRFLRNQDAPEAWGDLWRRDAASAARVRPWLRGAEATRHVTGADQPAEPGRRSPSPEPAARPSIGGE